MSDHKPSGVGRRASARLRSFLPARVAHGAKIIRAMLCDLSVDGAMIMVLGLPEATKITLQWSEFEAAGLIRWSDGQLSGLSFDAPISWEVVLATREEQDKRGFSARTAEDWITGGTDGKGPVVSV